MGGGRGVFSYYFIKGIQGLSDRNNDNAITIAELGAYLPFAVADATGNIQHPEIEGNAKQALFVFSPKLKQQAKNDVDKPQQIHGDMGTGITDNLTPKIAACYKKYLEYIKQGRLVYGKDEADTLDCARCVYEQLINNPDAKPVQASLKSSFIAALQRSTQQMLDNYLQGNKGSGTIGFKKELKEVNYVKKLIGPGYILYNYVMARSLFMESFFAADRNASVQLLKRALEYEEDAPYVLNCLGIIFTEINKPDSAIAYYQKAVTAAPQWAQPYGGLGIVYDFENNPEKEVAYYQKSLQLDSTNAIILHNLGVYYQSVKAYDKALTCEQKAINSYTAKARGYQFINNYTKSLYFSLGIDYHELKIYDKAQTAYQQVIQIDSAFEPVYNNLGFLYVALKDYDKAIINYKKSVSLDSTDADSYNYLGLCYACKKDFNTGIGCLQKSLRMANTDSMAVYYNMACAYSLHKNTRKSLAFLEQAMQKGYKGYDQLMHDDALDNIKKKHAYAALVKKYLPDKVK
jgi:tetratricopeptide (TPR) repeat protein